MSGGAQQALAEAAVYEIRVDGVLDGCWAGWFPGFDLAAGNGETILRGAVADQAALHGVLARLRDLGVTLLTLQRGPVAPDQRSNA